MAKLSSLQPPPQILYSKNYSTMKPPPQLQAVLVVVGPFNTPGEAQALCPQIKAADQNLVCYLAQPQP
jgi:hypothetical protein